jgi:hypothetical protein
MYLSEIYVAGFRCFPWDAPLSLRLQRGLNILVGPNDAGKTAVIDAPRYVLWTRGDDCVRLEATDFHAKADGTRASELLIRCTFEGLSPDEEARFLEWCTNESGKLHLHLCLRGTRRQLPGGGDSVFTQYRAGKDADGLSLEGELREYLRSTYLRPLRNAERELRPGRRSRLFQRRDGSKIPIPVALIPDRDIPPAAAKGLVGVRLTENEWEETKKAVHLADLKKDEGGAVAVFTSEQWTLEFDLARKPALAIIVHQAIKLAKGAANKTDQEIKDSAEAEITDWRTARKSDEEIAVLIFDDLYKKRASKAETAQRLAQLIDSLGDDAEAFKAKIPEYLSSAIDHATSFGAPSAALAPASGLASRC